jgi:hypothetical protein
MSIDPDQKDRWLREFQLNGFVVLRNFLPADFVRAMHEELTPLLDAEYAKSTKDGFVKGRAQGRLALHLEHYAGLWKGALADDRYQRNPVIEELVNATLGAGRWERGWTLVEAAWKGSAFMSWHSDLKPEEAPDPRARHQPVRVTYNIPLVGFTWESGAMEVVPGSHLLPRDFGGVLGVANIYPYRLNLALGDAVFRDSNILHRGTPNLTDRVRPMLDQTYRLKRDGGG